MAKAAYVPREPPQDAEIKSRVYTHIQKQVQAVIDEKVQSKGLTFEEAKRIFDEGLEIMMAGLLKEGFFRFPGGYGILRVKSFKVRGGAPVGGRRLMPTRDNLPDAPVVRGGMRKHVKFQEGVETKRALGTYKGNYVPKVKRKKVSK